MRLPIDFGAAGGWVPADRILPLGSRCLEAGISRGRCDPRTDLRTRTGLLHDQVTCQTDAADPIVRLRCHVILGGKQRVRDAA